MQNVIFSVLGSEIRLVSKPKILTYNKEVIKAEFVFSKEWNATKTAIFSAGVNVYSVLIDNDNTCDIPQECYFDKNLSFQVGVICGDEDLKTTNIATVSVNKSCYETGTTIPKPTDDVYTQIIKKLEEMGQPEVTDEQLERVVDEYFQANPIIAGKQTYTTVIFKINGGKTHWNTQDTSTCYKVDILNQWNFIPCKLSPWIATGNSNDISHYCSVTADGKGVQLVEDITSKVKKITTEGNVYGAGQNWGGISLKLIASTLDTTDEQKKSDYNYLNDNIFTLFNDDLPPGNIKRHKSFVGINMFSQFVHTDNPNLFLIRDNMVLNYLMWSGSQDDYVSDESYVMITFWDK